MVSIMEIAFIIIEATVCGLQSCSVAIMLISVLVVIHVGVMLILALI